MWNKWGTQNTAIRTPRPNCCKTKFPRDWKLFASSQIVSTKTLINVKEKNGQFAVEEASKHDDRINWRELVACKGYLVEIIIIIIIILYYNCKKYNTKKWGGAQDVFQDWQVIKRICLSLNISGLSFTSKSIDIFPKIC